jgi:peptidoglycan hydrolase CwlO-like protein
MSKNVLYVVIVVLVLAIIGVSVYDNDRIKVSESKAKMIEEENYNLKEDYDSVQNDNFALLLNVTSQEIEIDSLKKSTNDFILLVKHYKNRLHESDQNYFNNADDSTIIGIFDRTNITP